MRCGGDSVEKDEVEAAACGGCSEEEEDEAVGAGRILSSSSSASSACASASRASCFSDHPQNLLRRRSQEAGMGRLRFCNG